MFSNESTIRIIVQKYDRVFCYFKVSQKDMEEYNKIFGEEGYNNSKAYLKVFVKQQDGYFSEWQTIEIDVFTDNWYVELGRDDLELYVAYGREYGSEGFFEIMKSNIVVTPRINESIDTNVEYINVLGNESQNITEKKGYVSLILHTHIPYVRHIDKNEAIEEKWFFESMLNCYLPLVEVYENLKRDNINFKITMSITPTLMSMFEDEYMNEKFEIFIKNAIELSKIECERTGDNKEKNDLAIFYFERFNRMKNLYESFDKRIMNAFKKYDDLGNLEIITSSATHAILPIISTNIEAAKAQIKIGVEYYNKIVGHYPKGIWLPECAFSYELIDILKQNNIKYFISEDVGINNGSPKPLYGTANPVTTLNGICAFGRDKISGGQVWSSIDGYPGDFDYREFYKDIAYEISEDEVLKYINPEGVRVDTGIKYYRITGNTEEKALYNRDRALEKTKLQAQNFFESRMRDIDIAAFGMNNRKPIIVSPYDTELFGHWWFEGPDFIEDFLRKSTNPIVNYEVATPSEYLEQNPYVQVSVPSPATWGENSDFSVWINSKTDWVYKKLDEAAEKLIEMVNRTKRPRVLVKRALNQACRELVMAQSSDWTFIIKNGTSVNYAENRLIEHLNKFEVLISQIDSGSIDKEMIEKMEKTNNIFSDMDYRYYKTK